ncbi:UAA transporter family-domain-containing protein [Schizophyllum commune]
MYRGLPKCCRLGLCVGGVYAMFLIWAIAQERLSVPFESIDGTPPAKFKSALIMSTCQSAFSALAALLYISIRRQPGVSFSQAIGLEPPAPKPSTTQTNGSAKANGHAKSNGDAKSNGHASLSPNAIYTTWTRPLMRRFLQTSVFIVAAAPFGFASLQYISYPAMVLGKSCKLVPVMLMNVLLYRRRFAPYKYLVVGMVTLGISLFMHFGGGSGKKHGAGAAGERPPHANLIGLSYLLINLALDGAVNASQDEIFARFKGLNGQQMMLWMNTFGAAVNLLLAVLPLPYIPVIHPSDGGQSELASVLAFVRTHPGVLKPLAQFALTGALGQLFIFETLQHFGSLTLVTITLTRKMFTMLLSVFMYDHKLTPGQWAGAGVVFAGISVEAYVKRKEVHAKRVIQEKEKASIKQL